MMILDKRNNTTTVNPFTDPKHDINNPLRYIPSNALSAVGVAFYFLVSCLMIVLLVKSRWSARYMLCVIIGGYCMSFGLAMRFALAKHPDSSGDYIIEYLFVVLSPCAFIAGNYILLGRLSRHLRQGHQLLVNPWKITKIFIASDITTFLIQSAGGGLSTAHQVKTAETGSHIFLAGLALQMASYFFFTIVYIVFLWRVSHTETWTMSTRVDADGTPWSEVQGGRKYTWWRDWRALAGALSLSCVGILIRSVYRTIELSQGYVGPLATNEATFYGLDTLPLFIAITTYLFFWPGRFIDETRLRAEVLEQKRLEDEANGVVSTGTDKKQRWWSRRKQPVTSHEEEGRILDGDASGQEEKSVEERSVSVKPDGETGA